MNTEKIKSYALLHIILLIYSGSMILSKTASAYPLWSLPFLLFYGGAVMVLGIYALLWQQVLKRLPLTTAFANKAVTIIWGLVFGKFLFQEQVTVFHIIGSVVIMSGIGLVVSGE